MMCMYMNQDNTYHFIANTQVWILIRISHPINLLTIAIYFMVYLFKNINIQVTVTTEELLQNYQY